MSVYETSQVCRRSNTNEYIEIIFEREIILLYSLNSTIRHRHLAFDREIQLK